MIKSFEYFVVIWFCYFDIYLDTLKILRTHPLRQTKKRKIKTKKKRDRERERGNNRVHTIIFNFACLFIVYFFELQLVCCWFRLLQNCICLTHTNIFILFWFHLSLYCYFTFAVKLLKLPKVPKIYKAITAIILCIIIQKLNRIFLFFFNFVVLPVAVGNY